jgi:quinol monooxygenase YgiN
LLEGFDLRCVPRWRLSFYDAWKQVYDSVRDVQREGGVRYQRVMRSADDPNMVVVVHEFESRDAAKGFFDNPALRDAMERAGVDESSLQLEFLDDVGGGEL